MEMVISVTILVVVAFGFFNLYLVLKNNEESNYDSTELMFFSEYVYRLLSRANIPDFSPGQRFYLRTANNIVSFTDNPAHNGCDVDFFPTPGERCSHEINSVHSGALSGIPYRIYQVNISYHNEKNSFYIIR